MSEARNRATIDALVVAINDRDLAALDEVFTEDRGWPRPGALASAGVGPQTVTPSKARCMGTHQDDRIDYVEFPATGIAATKAFYGAVFGWTAVSLSRSERERAGRLVGQVGPVGPVKGYLRGLVVVLGALAFAPLVWRLAERPAAG